MTVEIGKSAPDFTMAGVPGPQSLAQYRGKKLVLYFYPKDDTSGCTTEAKAFRDEYEVFKSLNAEVLGVSRDSLSAHEKFKAKHELPFPLATDEDGSVCEQYGVWKDKNMYGRTYKGIERSTFLIDENGIVVAEWRKVKVSGHIAAVLQAIR